MSDNNNDISLNDLERINPANNNDLLIPDEYNNNHVFNFQDVSLEFFVKCSFLLDQAVRQTRETIIPDDSELYFD